MHLWEIEKPRVSLSGGCRVGWGYPEPGGSVGFPGNSSGKSQASYFGSTSVASVHWLCCNITLTG